MQKLFVILFVITSVHAKFEDFSCRYSANPSVDCNQNTSPIAKGHTKSGVLSFIFRAVVGLVKTLLKNPASLLSNVKDLFLPSGQSDIAKVSGPIRDLSKDSNVTTVGAVGKICYKVFDVPFNVDELPDEIVKRPVNVTSVMNALTERYAKKQFGMRELLDAIIPENCSLLDVILSAPSNIFNVITNFYTSIYFVKFIHSIFIHINGLVLNGNNK